MYAHFYDNSSGNRDVHLMCPFIKFHKVRDNPLFMNDDGSKVKEMLSTESDMVQRVYEMYNNHFTHAYYDPTSGYALDDGSDFFQHVINKAQSDNVSAFVFDWDRTLQPFEVMSIKSFDFWCYEFGAENPPQRHEFSQALAIYHAGGTERFHKLKHMFAEIQRHAKSIHILTANHAVLSPGRSVYVQILAQWGVKYYNLKYSSNKYYTMATDPLLSTICGPIITF